MQLQPGVTLTDSNGEVLFFDEAREQVYGVDGPVAEALTLLAAGRTLGESIDALLEVYDVPRDVLEKDVGAVLADMERLAVLRMEAPAPH